MRLQTTTIRFGLLGVSLTAMLWSGCADSMLIEKADRSKRDTNITKRNFEIDVQPIMRGTVASETAFLGDEPTIVRGYGLVVDLKGTGSRIMPAPIRAFMLQEMARRGIGDAATGWRDLSPEKMLDSDNTAVAIVEGVIPPGGVKGEHFDLRVTAVPGSSTSSLEGGMLYTTELRPGPLTVGSRQAKARATGRGRVFINPFAEPDAAGRDSIDRLTGRVLDGGTISENMPIKLLLAMRSHARAMAVRDAINSRFPKEAGQTEDTAHGKSGDEIMITVPPSFSKEPSNFLNLVRHTSLVPEAVDRTALEVRRSVVANPGLATGAAWRWKALGPKAVPMFQDLYDYPEEGPRLAALTAGAYLNDPVAVRPMLNLAKTGSVEGRISSIQMLGNMGSNPEIDMGLRTMLDDENVDIRLITFETLEKRNDPIIGEFEVDKKFLLNVVPSKKPLIYVSQTGSPRVVVFGETLEVDRPLILSTWSSRLLIKGDSPDEDLEIYFREADGIPAQIEKVSPKVIDLVAFLGHKTTIEAPAPGIGLSYGETIGAIHRLWREGHLSSDFKAEQDRVLAAILRAQQVEEMEDRPEFESDLPTPAEDEKPGSGPGRVEPRRKGGDTVPR